MLRSARRGPHRVRPSRRTIAPARIEDGPAGEPTPPIETTRDSARIVPVNGMSTRGLERPSSAGLAACLALCLACSSVPIDETASGFRALEPGLELGAFACRGGIVH